MSSNAEKLLEEALRLPEKERLRLAERLLATFDGVPDADAAEAWQAEIARRSRELEAGLVKPIPWSDVKESARKQGGSS
jgi:putative addiction module component (TIGR02574 family)